MEPVVKALIIITILGILNTVYLSYHTITRTAINCLFFPDEWCEKVQKSQYSRTFGIPNPYLGLAMLLSIFFLVLLYSSGKISFVPAFLIISAGFAFSCYFLYIQAVKLKAYCTWCVASFLVFALLFILGLIALL